MLTIRSVRGGTVTGVGVDGLAAALAHDDGFVWVDLSDPTPAEDALLDDPALGLDPFVREDMREDVHLPKLDVYPDHVLLTVHALELETSAVELSTNELDIAFGRRFVVTYHRRPVHTVEAVADQLPRITAGVDRPVQLVHRLLDVMDDVFVPFLDLMGQRLDQVEEDVIESPTARTRDEIFALRRDLITLRRISVPQAEVIRRLGREQVALLSAADRALFRDIHDHLYRMAEVSEAYRQLVESAYDMYRSVREDETNRRLTVLTMISSVLLPITVLAGIYGMNFEHMPELDERWAYPTLWGVFILIIVVNLLVFRSWGWIGRGEDDEELARRSVADRIEIPGVDLVLKVPQYGARFALASGRRVFGLTRWLANRGARR